MKKRILIINTGGTLSSVNGENGLMPGMKSRDMLDELRMVSRNLELETEDFCSVDSANIFPEDWARLAELIAKRSRDYQGIAVIHGTDTLAYTASMLSFYASEYFHSGSGNRKSAVHSRSCGRRYGKLPLRDSYGGWRLSGSICGI